MNSWGEQLKASVEGVAQACGMGLGVGKDTLAEYGGYGNHLLAPTATDLAKYGREGESESPLPFDLRVSAC